MSQNFTIHFNPRVVHALYQSVRQSPQWYFELKLFFLRQSFAFLSVSQLDELLAIFDIIF